MHYPQDVTTFSIDDEFLLGEDQGGQLVVGRERAGKKLALWEMCLWMPREGGVSEACGTREHVLRGSLSGN